MDTRCQGGMATGPENSPPKDLALIYLTRDNYFTHFRAVLSYLPPGAETFGIYHFGSPPLFFLPGSPALPVGPGVGYRLVELPLGDLDQLAE